MLKITSDISFSDPVFYSIALCLLAIAFFVNRRINTEFKSKQPNSFIDNVYVYLVVISILAIFIGAATMFTSRIYSMVSYPKYESVVVDVVSRMEEKSDKDPYGKTYTESVMMHTAIVEFHDSNNNLVRKKNTASSALAPSLGDIITVTYKDEAIAEYSFRIVLILFALGVVTTLLGIVSVGIVLFAFNKSINPVKVFGANFMVYFVIPVVILYFAIGMVHLLWDNSVNDGDMTIPEQLAALFFALIMPPCLIMYCKFTFGAEKGEGGAVGLFSGKDDE